MAWFSYSQRSDEETPKPYFVFHLCRGERKVPVLAVIDSGADYSALELTHARRIGCDMGLLRESEAVGAEGEPFTCWYAGDAGLEIEVGEHRFPFRGVLLEGETNVLGRRDFFLHFEVCFDEANLRFSLEVNEAEVEDEEAVTPSR